MSYRLVLQYKRSMRDGGRCTGQVSHVDAKDVVVGVLDHFDLVEFPQMLRIFANCMKASPSSPCCFQRIDKVGFPITEWAPAHVEQLRNDTDKAIAELSEIKTVTYDMRKRKDEE